MPRAVILLVVVIATFIAPRPGLARDEVLMMPIREAINLGEGREKLDGTVKFYFANQSHPRVSKSFGTQVTNKKTNAFAKGDAAACHWVFLSALIQLQDYAKKVGANAVVNIVSFYKKAPFGSDTMYECHKGFLMAGVALRGEVATTGR